MDLDTQTQEALKQAVSLGGISSLGSAAYEILTAEHLTWRGFFRGLVLAVLVAVTCFEGMRSLPWNDGVKFVITAVGAFCADYILRAVIALAKYATSKPVELFIRIVKG